MEIELAKEVAGSGIILADFIDSRVSQIENDLKAALNEITISTPESPNSVDLLKFTGYRTNDELLKDYITDMGGLDKLHEIVELKEYHKPSYDHSLRTGIFTWAAMKYLIDNGKMNVTAALKSAICIAGISHDFGKLNVPVEILDSKDKLTSQAWKKIQSHVDAEDIVRDYLLKDDGIGDEAMDVIVDLIQGHHPRYGPKLQNGFGELLTIADCLDAAMYRGGYQNKITSDSFISFIGAMKKEGVFHDRYAEPFIEMLEKHGRRAERWE